MELVEAFSKAIKDENWVVILILGIVIAIPLFRLLYGAYAEFKKRKVDDLKSALEIEGLSEDARFVILESLNRTYFYRATGVSGDNYMRGKVRKFLESTRGDVSIFGLWRASEYININDGKLVVRFEWYDRVSFYLHIVSSVLMLLISTFLWVMLIFVWQAPVIEKLPIATQALLFVVMSIWFGWKASNFYIAKTWIKPALERYEQSGLSAQKGIVEIVQECHL